MDPISLIIIGTVAVIGAGEMVIDSYSKNARDYSPRPHRKVSNNQTKKIGPNH